MISWFKDGMPLPGMGRHNSDHFIVRGVTRDDRGMYQCIVRRAEGDTAQSSAELQLGGEIKASFTSGEVSIRRKE